MTRSKCCEAETTEEGQCLNCGDNARFQHVAEVEVYSLLDAVEALLPRLSGDSSIKIATLTLVDQIRKIIASM